jgi:hypothetical protein
VKRPALLAALGALLAADAFVLVDVARRGPAETVLRLTADELHIPKRNEENAPLVARLHWDGTKTPAPADRAPAIPGFAVLELADGAAPGKTRLRVVDAGSDPGDLRAKYPDRGRYAISQAVLGRWPQLSPDSIYIPSEYLPALRKPDYELSLCFGARGQVWVCGATR